MKERKGKETSFKKLDLTGREDRKDNKKKRQKKKKKIQD